MRWSGFERKIVAAIAAVAIVPLVGALLLGQRALREAYAVGVNRQVGEQLDAQLELYRSHFAALRADAERTAQAVAQDYGLCEALAARAMSLVVPPGAGGAQLETALDEVLERYENLAAVRVAAADGAQFRRARPARAVPERTRPLSLTEPLACGGEVSVTVVTDERPFHEYQRAGEVVEVYRALEERSRYVSGFFLAVYIAFLLSVIVVALGVGIVLSRRVTRRVALLAEATQRVGWGDLAVEVPSDDRDEVGELTRAFNSMVRDLRESGERIEYLSRIGAWQEFARRLAHEIKNPLTPIQLAVQQVHRTYDGSDARYRRTLDEACAIVEEEIATLRRMVGEFSAFARLPQVTLTSSDLAEFIEDAVHLPALEEDLAVAEHGITIRVISANTPIRVRIDAMLLKRCVDNLVRNAVQALRDQPERTQGLVLVAARREGQTAVIEVRDDGPGIAPEQRARVFDPYYTTKRDGTGLGLAIVKKIVLEHGGSISCHPASEGGACFRIALPVESGVAA